MPEPHNIIVIYADDMRADELRYTPAIRKLAREGTCFTNAHQNQGMCRPARASFLRGQRAGGPDGHGVNAHDSAFTPIESESLAPWLENAGYHNGVIGKYFNNLAANEVRAGWHYWRCGVGKAFNHAWGYQLFDGNERISPRTHQSHFFSRLLLTFMARKGPWFMWFCTNTPHTPLEPTPRHADAWQGTTWPAPPPEEDFSLKPSWMQALPEPGPDELDLMREFQRRRLAELLDLDHTVAAVQQRLIATGEYRHTTLIVTSDNGNHLMEHRTGILRKNTVYRESTHVPLVISGPDFPAATVIDSLVYACVDTTATILELAGVTPTVNQDGVSLREIAHNPDIWKNRELLCTRTDSDSVPGMPDAAWIITPSRKLIRFEADGNDRYEAYDLDSDPGELYNWAPEENRLDERNALEARLDYHLQTPAAEVLENLRNAARSKSP